MPAFTPMGVTATVKNVQKFQKNLGVMQGAITGVATAVATFAIDAAVKMTKAVIGLGVSSVESAISFESAFAGVIKTTEGLTDETGNLTEAGADLQAQFRDLSKEVPTSVEELLKIGETGGQLGIARDDLLEFTRTITAMGEATNLSTDDAATQFAQLANIMGTVEREGTEAFSKMGSAIVALGNNFATTESDISNFASRIAGAGAIAGLTEADVFAIGAAMSSVGIQAEAGGTAVQKTLLAMNEAVINGGSQLEIFAGTAGMATEDFAKLWEEDAGAGFEAFVEGLGEMGDDALFILDELGLKDQRLIRSFLSLANAGDLLERTMDLSNTAFEENSALQKEAAQRYATTESQIAMMKNTFKDIGITAGNTILPMFNDMLTQAKPFIEQVGGWLEDNLPGIIENIGGFIMGTLVPAFTEVWNWLGANLPGAIAKLSAFWKGTLLPAFETAQTFIVGTLIPAFNNLVAFFESEGPGALETLSAIWDEVWGTIKSVAETFVTWFDENLPLIIETGQTLMDFWENTLAPALEGAWEIIKGVVKLAMDNIMSSITLIMQIINGDWEGAWNTIKEMAANTWDTIKETVKNFIAAIQPIIDRYVAWWLKKWNEGLEKAKTIWNNIKTAVTDWVDGIRQSVITKMEEVKATWTGIWENIKLAASTVWANITTAITAWFIGLGTETENKLTGIKEFWVGIWEGIKGIVAEKIAAIKETINNILTSLFAAMGLDLEEMKQRWAAIFNDVKEIAAEIWSRISNAIIERVTRIKTKLSIIWSLISAAAAVVWATVKEFISTTWDTISTYVSRKITEVQTFLATTWDTISTKVSNVWDAVSLKISTVWDTIKTNVETRLALLRDAAAMIWNEISTKISETWDAIILVVTEKVQLVKTTITEKIEDIMAWFIDKVEDWKDLGRAIIDGLISGITEKAGRLISAVTGAVEGAIEKAKALLLMGSPSKVFMEIGVNTMLGFAQGIEGMIPDVQALMNAAVMPHQVSAAPIVSQSNVSIQVGPNTIADQIDQAMFENRVLQIITGAL